MPKTGHESCTLMNKIRTSRVCRWAVKNFIPVTYSFAQTTSSPCSRIEMALETYRKRSRDRASSSRQRSDSPPRINGVRFSDYSQRDRFVALQEREVVSQNFICVDTLQDIGVFDGIQTLLNNLGWGTLMNTTAPTYRILTLEFMSSVFLDHGELNFRLCNEPRSLTRNQICQFINSPTNNTFGPDRRNRQEDLNSNAFWNNITGIDRYVARTAKASSIIHPVLKVLHRIVASILFPRRETSTVSSKELQLLWCAVTNSPQKPNFGAYVCDRLIKESQKTTGEIHGGGLVTLLARFLHIRIPHTMERLEDGNTLTGEVLEYMKLYYGEPQQNTWVVGPRHTPYLIIDDDDVQTLALADPASNTNWQPPSNVGGEEDEQAENEDAPPQQQQGWGDYGALQEQIDFLREDVVQIDDNVHALRGDFDDYVTAQQRHNREMERHNREVERMMQHVYHWTLGHPPPPPGPQ
ncbi:hypothetical protein L2E82_32778 [Cichorium intybus]|uniref:Uncharacterized protein n=1 Tax=Cichorium intybus TaxID=13427 RepID=A0ACB9BHQ8_CICIN|nr:hypothetical protein L2E82_32778 [Cichorium intybus]